MAYFQAMQGRIGEAQGTFDRAEQLPGAQLRLTRIRRWLERGRVYSQARRRTIRSGGRLRKGAKGDARLGEACD